MNCNKNKIKSKKKNTFSLSALTKAISVRLFKGAKCTKDKIVIFFALTKVRLKQSLSWALKTLLPYRPLIITEAVMFVLVTAFVFYCQYFVSFNSFKDSIKTAFMFSGALFLFAVCYGSAILMRAKFFNGEYKSPLADDGRHYHDHTKPVDNKDRVYGVLNQL